MVIVTVIKLIGLKIEETPAFSNKNILGYIRAPTYSFVLFTYLFLFVFSRQGLTM